MDSKSKFLATLSKEFEGRLNLKNFASWLKEEHGLLCGSTKNSVQGGGGKFDPKLKAIIADWLKQEVAGG